MSERSIARSVRPPGSFPGFSRWAEVFDITTGSSPGSSAGSAADDMLFDVAAQSVYLGRQPILDRNGALNAYELLFRAGAHNYAEISDDAQATAQVVARTIGGIGVAAVLRRHRGFVTMYPA